MRFSLLTFFLISLSGYSAFAEETSPPITLASGLRMTEQPTCTKDSTQKVAIRSSGKGHVISVHAFFPCDGDFEQPWMSPSYGEGATLALKKAKPKGIGFASNCECLYKLNIEVAPQLLTKGDTLYVTAEQVVVGHKKVP